MSAADVVRIAQPLATHTGVIAVPFLDGHILCAWVNDEPMVLPKPISDLMGLNWAGQYTKLRADQTACIEFISIQMPDDDQARRTLVMSLETFTVWLASLQPSRVADHARDTVIAYKREAGRALREHFFGAAVAKASDDLDVIQSMLNAIRADRERINLLESRQAVVQAKVEAIEGRYDWFTALGFAKLHDHPTDRTYLQRVGTKAGRLLRARGDEPVKRQDATFGSINTYPADVLSEAFAAVSR